MDAPRPARIACSGLLPIIALCALCVCLCACASSALAFGPIASADSSHATHKTERHVCAKRASFHASGGAHGHRKYRAKCHKTGRKVHHHTLTHHAAKRHTVTHHAARHSKSATQQQASHASAGGDCPNAEARPDPGNLELVREATMCLVNRERTSRGESALQADPQLQQAAQGHSQDMASGDYFDHVGRAGDTPLDRMRAAGYIFSSHVAFEVGENIGWGTLWLASPRAMVAAWMASPGHRANILDAHFQDTGVGISPHPLASFARGQAGAIYTQDFGVIITR
jgi:uncharacterized protein YkwD